MNPHQNKMQFEEIIPAQPPMTLVRWNGTPLWIVAQDYSRGWDGNEWQTISDYSHSLLHSVSGEQMPPPPPSVPNGQMPPPPPSVPNGQMPPPPPSVPNGQMPPPPPSVPNGQMPPPPPNGRD